MVAAITSLRVNGKNYISDLKKPLQLKYWQPNFSVEFSSMNFIDPQLDHFYYKLKGYDKDWNDAGNERFANYTNIPGGNYTFLVKVQNSAGIWSKPAELQVHIDTVFYKTWPFILSCIFVSIALLYVFYSYRINQIKKIYLLRTNIARIFHDEIGSTLSSISLRSEMAEMKMKSQSGEVKEIVGIRTDARNLVELMSDIVWTINPLNDNMEQLMVRMQNFATEILAQRNIELSFTVDKKVISKKLPLAARRDIYLIFKEAINNAAKYSCAASVTVEFTLNREELIMLIKDDGKGFDSQKKLHGNGLVNMNARAKEIGAALAISSEHGKGTTIIFRFR